MHPGFAHVHPGFTPATILSLLLAASVATAQNFDRDRVVGDGPSSARQIAPKAQIGPDGTVYVIWTDFRGGGNGQVFLAKSTNAGETFSQAGQVTNANGLQAGMQRGAQFVVDRTGVLHMVWQERNARQKISVRYARSTDRGESFSTPLAIAADSGMHNQDFPSIAADSSGNPYVTWIDTRDLEKGLLNHAQLYVTRSSDGGLSFGTPVRATLMPNDVGGTCECCNTSIAVSKAGSVFISFRSNIADNRDIYIARSTDGAASFAIIKAASESWVIGACPMTGSSIAVDGNETAHVAWRDSRASSKGRDYIYYTSLRRGDSACARDRRICTTPTRSNYPSLGITAEGGILCAFQDNRNDDADVFYVESTDGTVFTPEVKLTHEAGASRQELPSVAVASDGTRFIVWQDGREGQPHIMLARAQAGAGTAPAAPGATFAFGSVRPHPVRRGARSVIDLSLPSYGPVRATIYDALGHELHASFVGNLPAGEQHIDLNTSGLAQGMYVCVVRFGGSSLARSIVVRE